MWNIRVFKVIDKDGDATFCVRHVFTDRLTGRTFSQEIEETAGDTPEDLLKRLERYMDAVRLAVSGKEEIIEENHQ